MSERAEQRIAEEKKAATGKLDLNFCDLSSIPESLLALTGLQTLNLSRNQISDISFLEKLTGLQSLDLRHNQISDYSFLENLTGLQSLDLRHNQISDIRFLENLTGLQTLYLSGSQISDIGFLENLTSLQELDLSGNQISDYSFLENLTGLKELYLSSNQISDISFLEKLTGLQTLYLSGNQISDIGFLENLTSLESLYLSSNQISDYSFLENLTGLQTLKLSNNQISDISFLEKLTGLESLNLSNNQISDIRFLENLTGLQSLYLSGNHISDISFLENLTGLNELNLDFNQISDIRFLENLTGLKELNLSDNQIIDIRFSENLTGLKELNLSHNQIRDIRPLTPQIQKGLSIHLEFELDGIIVEGNPIESPPKSIIKEGREAILNWFDQLDDQGEAPLYETKMMILGQGGAGKTTFARLKENPDYDLAKDQPKSTLGIDVYENIAFDHQAEECQGISINTRLWDFGGQNIQKMLHQFFITEDCLYVLVHDKRKENTDFDYWFQIIDLLGPKSPVIVLENQKEAKGNNEAFALAKYQDLFKELDIDRKELNLGLTRSNHKSRWKKLNALIEEKLSDLEIVNQKVPAKWSNVRSLLTNKKDEKYLRIDEFYKLCANEPIGLTEEQAHLCLTYLKALGDVVYFEDRELGTHIFLDHNWLTEGVYFILSDTQIEKNRGKFTRHQAYDKWDSKEYSVEAKSKLLGLMLKNQFDLCYEISEDVFITPLLLPTDRPKSAKSIDANVHFRFQYGFMPHGLFSRAIVRLHERIDGEKRWKSGVLLVDKNTGAKAEVQQYNDPKENQQVIDVKIKGKPVASKGMLDFVRRSIEPLHKEFKNLRVVQKVGCNCSVCQVRMTQGDNPSFYDYKELLAKIEHRRYFIDCPNDGYQPVNIGQILSEVVTEDAAEKSLDNELLYRLKDMGMSINHIKNENTVNQSDFGKSKSVSKSKSKSKSISKAEAKAKAEVNIEIQTLLGDTEVLKEDIERELKIKKVPEEEIQYAVSDVEMAEKALAEMEAAESIDQVPPKSKSRLRGFIDDLSDEGSTMYKTLKMLRKGQKHGVKLAETYNKIAGNFALPLVPPAALEVIKAI